MLIGRASADCGAAPRDQAPFSGAQFLILIELCLTKSGVVQWVSMRKISVELTLEELQTLVTMADNQLFRIKYIDSRIPGNIGNPEALRMAQAAVQVLQDALKKGKGFKPEDSFVLKGNSSSKS